MRSNHLKSHMKINADLSFEDSEQICKSIPEDDINDINNEDETSMYRKKTKVNDMHSDKLDESHKPLTVGVDKMELENSIVIDDNEFHHLKIPSKMIYHIPFSFNLFLRVY